MPHTISEKIRRWSQEYLPPIDEEAEYAPPEYAKIERQIDYLNERLFCEYDITRYTPYLDFQYRLRDWLYSAKDENDQKILFQLVPRLLFIGRDEYISLYRTAFNRNIAWWLIEQLNLKFNQQNVQGKLQDALKSTWFCAITDSMQISKFYHVNQIKGVEFRPDWRVLRKFGNKKKIVTYMNDSGLKRIVLMEDFVGTGFQMRQSVDFAMKLGNDCQILLCPLVVCPSGDKEGLELEKSSKGRVSYSPVFLLERSAILKKSAQLNEDPYLAKLRSTVVKLWDRVKGPRGQLRGGPFGFGEKCENGGMLVVLYTNCPNNSLPIIHNQVKGVWSPIFPRSSRV